MPRKKVRAHTINILGEDLNPSKALAADESLSTVLSGYVHAASENIMNMYGGNPPQFHIAGMLGTPRVTECIRTTENYVYRGLLVTIIVAKAFGDAPLVDELHDFLAKYTAANGREPPFTDDNDV